MFFEIQSKASTGSTCQLVGQGDSTSTSDIPRLDSWVRKASLIACLAFLTAAGLSAEAVDREPPKGAGEDDLLDALACAAIARRIHARVAEPFPNPPPRDALEEKSTKRSTSKAPPEKPPRSASHSATASCRCFS